MKRIFLIVVFFIPSALWADDGVEPSTKKTDVPPFGQATVDWLELQRSGVAGSETIQAATPVVQEKAVKRFMDTYNHAIPEFYNRDSFVSGGK